MNVRATAVVVCALVALPFPAAAQSDVPLTQLRCGASLDDTVDFQIVYGPHWDGAWRLVALRGTEREPPKLVVEALEVAPAGRAAQVTARAERAAGGANMRSLRNASAVMIAEMQRLAEREEEPTTRDQRRPLTIQVNGALGVQCADGFADWPRIPGSYFFSAVELVADWVQHPAGRDPWGAVRLQLQQVRSPWQ